MSRHLSSKVNRQGFYTSILIAAALIFSVVATNVGEAASTKQVLVGPISGEVIKVLDGDTVEVRLQVWMGQNVETKVRINGIDTPEMRSRCAMEKEKAQQAKGEVQKLFKDNVIHLYNIQFGKYAGRVLADAKNDAGVNVADYMIAQGLARPYGGEKRQGWCSS